MAVVQDNDPRLSDARTPLPHKASHATGGSDAITPTSIGAVSTSDFRLSDTRTPKAHRISHSIGGSDALTPANIGAEVASKKGQINGYAGLDSAGLVPMAQLPELASGVLTVNSEPGHVTITPATIGAVPVSELANYLDATTVETALDGKASINDPKMSDPRDPKPHAATHAVGAIDVLTPASIGAVGITDSRLTNARTPTAHRASHFSGGSDPITPANIGAVPTTDARLSDARTPKTHVATHKTGGSDALAATDIGGVAATDSRLTNARTPTAHGNTHATGSSDPITPGSIGAATVTSLSNYQLRSEKGAPNGFAGLNSSGLVPAAQLPASIVGAVTSVNGQGGPTVVLNAANVGAVATTDARLTNARTPTAHAASHASGASDVLTPAAIGAIAATAIGAASGVAGLDSGGKVPTSQLPTFSTSSGVESVNGDAGPNVVLTVANITGAVATNDSRLTNARTPTAHASTHATGGSDVITPAAIGAATAASVVGLQATSAKGVANGYAGLNGSAIVPSAQLPATMTPSNHAPSHGLGGTDVITPASIGAASVSAISGFEVASNKGAANGYPSLNSSGLVPIGQLPATMAPSAHAGTHASGGSDPVTPAAIGAATTASLASYQLAAAKGAANGYASLDSSSKVPVAQLPNSQILVLSAAAPVPAGTPAGTVIARTAT